MSDPRKLLESKPWFPRDFNLDALLAQALSFAQQLDKNCTTARISSLKFSCSFILSISFDNTDLELISKSPLPTRKGSVAAGVAVGTELVVESEVATMRLVEKATKIPVPHVFAYASMTRGHAVGWPYILMSKAEGEQLYWDDNPCAGREAVMMSLAKMMHQLSSISFDKIGSIILKDDDYVITQSVHRSFRGGVAGPFHSAKDYYAAQLGLFERDTVGTPAYSSRVSFFRPTPNRENFDSLEAYLAAEQKHYEVNVPGYKDWDAPENIARYKRLHNELEEAIPELIDFDSREFILAHPDLHQANIFINPANYEISCIIDWECASTMPKEAFYVVPHLPSPRNPMDVGLRPVFLDTFEKCA